MFYQLKLNIFLNCLPAVWSYLLVVIRIFPVFALLSLFPALMDISKYWPVTKVKSLDWHLVIISSKNSEILPKVQKENQRWRNGGIERDQKHEMSQLIGSKKGWMFLQNKEWLMLYHIHTSWLIWLQLVDSCNIGIKFIKQKNKTAN